MNGINMLHDIISKIRSNYSYLSIKNINLDDLENEYLFIFENIKDNEDFVSKLVDLLGIFKDPHIKIYDKVNNKDIYSYSIKPKRNYGGRNLIKSKYISNIYTENSTGLIGEIGDSIYIYIGYWSESRKDEIFELFESYQKIIGKQKNIIIDIRPNQGGNDKYSLELLSYFIPENQKIPIANYLHRTDKYDCNELDNGDIKYKSGSSYYYKYDNIYILIGNYCISSTEAMIMGFKNLQKTDFQGNIKLIGDKTAGSSANPKLFDINDELGFTLPSWLCYTTDGKLLEGKGIEPDIYMHDPFDDDHDYIIESILNNIQ